MRIITVKNFNFDQTTTLVVSTQNYKNDEVHFPLRMFVWATINDEGSRAAASLGHNVASHTGVVGGVREPSLFDDQVVINGDQKVGVL